ncbi:MAG: DUF3848 domain-containing protein [Clostridiales bacterium]|jgi:hypothetical protein|nr:DUF3848 domain-containing protein [Clostridiales bacterium]
MQKDIYAKCVNGLIEPGDMVISTPFGDYGCLVGVVLEINTVGTLEHDTDNPGDDVHVNFYDTNFSENRIKEIEGEFSRMYGAKTTFYDRAPNDVIMPPEQLININGIDDEKLRGLLESRANAEAFCVSALRVEELKDRLTRNYDDYRDSILEMDKDEIIGEAGMIAAVKDTHYYLTETYEFEDSEVDYLLLFENPLEVVATKWCDRTALLDDFHFALHEVFNKKDALQGGFALYEKPVPPEPLPDKPVDIKQAARHEAERLLYELKSFKKPNSPDKTEYTAQVSPEFIGLAGDRYDKLLFEALRPPSKMTFESGAKPGDINISVTGGVLAALKVPKPSISDMMKEAADKANAHNATRSEQNSRKNQRREGESL